MLKHEIIFLGKTKERFIMEGIEEYSSRLQHYTHLSLKVIKEKKRGSISVEKAEGQQLLAAVPKNWLTVALDPAGRQISSEQLAATITDWELKGIKGVSYLIGGPTGLAPEVVKKANLCLSLSLLTFTHDMARLLLVEQLYRAYTIKAGEKYHK